MTGIKILGTRLEMWKRWRCRMYTVKEINKSLKKKGNNRLKVRITSDRVLGEVYELVEHGLDNKWHRVGMSPALEQILYFLKENSLV